jgi:hypothetical protein
LSDKENQHFPFKEPVGLCPEHPSDDTFLTKLREALEVDLHPGQTLSSSAKIKLQLFPVNEEIRTGLEKVVWWYMKYFDKFVCFTSVLVCMHKSGCLIDFLFQDGHNPYLELTLSGRKKISSVLRHIEKKWGSSSTAKGEPMLFPYNRLKNPSDRRRWTINDSDTTAAAVYAAVGNPAIFRLKYDNQSFSIICFIFYMEIKLLAF